MTGIVSISIRIIFGIFLILSVYSCEVYEDADSQRGEYMYITSDKPQYLNGEWEFYWNKFISYGEFEDSGTELLKSYMTVPSTWDSGGVYPAYGHATYRLKVNTDGQHRVYGIRLFHASSAYTVYINDTKIIEKGKASTHPDAHRIQHYNSEVAFFNADDDFEIIVHCSNYSLSEGGLWKGVVLGTYHNVLKVYLFKLAYEYFLFGSLVTMFLLNLIFFLYNRKDRAYLYFALYSIVIAFRITVTGEHFLFDIFPGIDTRAGFKFEYYTMYLSFPLYMLYISELFKDYFRPVFINVLAAISVVFILITAVFSPGVCYFITPLYQLLLVSISGYVIYAAIRLVIIGEDGSLFNLAGCVFLYITVIADIVATRVLHENFFTPTGLFVFSIVQSILLSLKFSASSKKIELLNRQVTKDHEKLYQYRVEIYRKYNITVKEMEICEMILSGKSNRELSLLLFKSEKTIEAQLTSIYKKFGITSYEKKLKLITLLQS